MSPTDLMAANTDISGTVRGSHTGARAHKDMLVR
jgi:hypothetical protein